MTTAVAAADTAQRFRVSVACASEVPAIRLDGLGFSCADVRRSFELAARGQPLDLTFYDNRGDRNAALTNVDEAIRSGTQLFIQYDPDTAVNAATGTRLKAAGIPALGLNHLVPGAPMYGSDNAAAGTIAGQALAEFSATNWRGAVPVAVVVGGAMPVESTDTRISGITAGLRRATPGMVITRLDGSSNERLEKTLTTFLAAQKGKKILIAALDDRSAVIAKEVVEAAGRIDDCVIVSQGLDRSMHGGMHDKREISPDNRGSIVLGSVAYFLDRYGYDVLPLALRMLRGETVPARTATRHQLITSANVFQVYPPTDMN